MTISGDTDDLVDTTVWGEVVTIRRNTPTYGDMGEATDAWADVASVDADLQPISGMNPTAAIGQMKISSHRAFFPDGTDIQQGDRLRPYGWSAGDDEYEVDAVLDDEGHIEARLSMVSGHG